MKLLPALVALSLLVGCSDTDKIERLEKEIAEPKKQLAVTSGGENVVERDEKGQKKSEGYLLDDGTKVGLWTYWRANGTKSAEREYKNGKLEGRSTIWHFNGQKWAEGEYKNGEIEGRWTRWHYNGQKWAEGEFKNGKQEGRWTYWQPDGYIDAEKSGIYKADKKIAPLPDK